MSKTKNYYNVRSKITGKFVKNSPRNSQYIQTEFAFNTTPTKRKCCGGKCKSTSNKIVPGRLYLFDNTVVVRAFGLVKNRRFISLHGQLEGFCFDNQLTECTKAQVQKYLDRAEN